MNYAVFGESQMDTEMQTTTRELAVCIACCRVTKSGIVWRGVSDMSQGLGRPGDIHQTDGFVSASKDRDVAKAFQEGIFLPPPVPKDVRKHRGLRHHSGSLKERPAMKNGSGGLFRIRITAGTLALDLTLLNAKGADDEAEVLFGPGTVCEVIRVKSSIVDLVVASTGTDVGAPDAAAVADAARWPVRYCFGSQAPENGLLVLPLASGGASGPRAIGGFLIDMRAGDIKDVCFRLDTEEASRRRSPPWARHWCRLIPVLRVNACRRLRLGWHRRATRRTGISL